MNRQFFAGMFLIIALGAAAVQFGMPYVHALATRDVTLGLLNCTAQYEVSIHGGIPYGGKEPRCDDSYVQRVVTSHTFSSTDKIRSGERVVCNFTRHDNWYFVWDKRGQGLFNDPTFSLEQCRKGRSA